LVRSRCRRMTRDGTQRSAEQNTEDSHEPSLVRVGRCF
jgi:hypothetical protein